LLQVHGSPAIANTIGPIGISPQLGLLGGISIATPDQLQLFELPASGAPTLIETNAFPTDNANVNAVGAVDFASDRVFALDCNNGIVALQILPPPSAPVIVTQPMDQTVKVGSNATFSVNALGVPTPSYQWFFNNIPIPGASTGLLVRSNAQPGNAGNYFVNVSNTVGSLTSSNMTLTILPLAPLWMQSLQPLPDGRTTLVVTGEPGYPYAVERSTNFNTWQEITNLPNPTGTSAFTDHATTNQDRGFYRARQ
jgi:hypothetical protein